MHSIAHVGVNVGRSLSYSAVKFFSKYFNLCEKHGSPSRMVRQTDGQTTYCRMTALCVASRGKNKNKVRVIIMSTLVLFLYLVVFVTDYNL